MAQLDFKIQKQGFGIYEDENRLFDIFFLKNAYNISEGIAQDSVSFLIGKNIRPIIYIEQENIKISLSQNEKMFTQIGLKLSDVKISLINNSACEINKGLYFCLSGAIIQDIVDSSILLLNIINADVYITITYEKNLIPATTSTKQQVLLKEEEDKDLFFKSILQNLSTNADVKFLSLEDITIKNKNESYLISKGHIYPNFILNFYDYQTINTQDLFTNSNHRPLFGEHVVLSTIPSNEPTSSLVKEYYYYNDGENSNITSVNIEVVADIKIEDDSMVGEISQVAFLVIYDKQNIKDPLYYLSLNVLAVDEDKTIYYTTLNIDPKMFQEGKFIFSVVLKQKIIDFIPVSFSVSKETDYQFTNNIVNIFSTNYLTNNLYDDVQKTSSSVVEGTKKPRTRRKKTK